MNLSSSDENYLARQIQTGQALLVLGAGASLDCKNRAGSPVKTAPELARLLCEESGLSYGGESLSTVYEAVRGVRLSDVQINNLLKREYSNVSPSDELKGLFSVSWRRVYTFNIDDAIENVTYYRSGQRPRYYNGMIDRVADFDGPLNIQIVYLHGQASKPEHGLIFSETDYAQAIRNERLYWYARAGQDYLMCPIFIGSRLDEPVLWAQIERAKRSENSASGLGFVVTPGKVTEVQQQSLRNKGIVHVQATLKDFVAWLNKRFPEGVSPEDIVKLTSLENRDVQGLKPEDLNAAHYLRPIVLGDLRRRLTETSIAEVTRRGRLFYQGFGPTWEIAASDIPAFLENSASLYNSLCEAVDKNIPLFVVTGQSGSGKTTAIMMALLRHLETGSRKLYEVLGDVRSVRHIFSVLKKIGDPCIIYIGDLFLYGDHLADDIDQIKGSRITVVTSARSGEWNEHFTRHLGRLASPFQYNRFTKLDHKPLLERLNRYVPAPSFKMMTAQEQEKKLASPRASY